MLEEMKIKDLLNILDFLKSNNSQIIHNGEDIRIVILQRGWVIIGKYYQNGNDCWIEKGFVIRVWGTEKGLGQLAIEGKQENTKLDKIPLTKFHVLSTIASIICDKEKWQEICK